MFEPSTNTRGGADLDGPEQVYTARIARAVAWMLVTAAIVVFIAHAVQGTDYVTWPLGFATSLLLIALYALHRGYLLPIAIATPSFLLLLLTYFCFEGNGIHDVSLIGFPVVIVLAGLVLGKVAIAVFGGACAGVLASLYLAETRGFIETPYTAATDAVDLISTSTLLAITGILLQMLIGRLTASLARARRQEHALAVSHRELERRNDELERFNYTVSHDLRSPLITIRGFLGYVERNAAEGNLERLRSDLARITGATDRMDRLLRDLLELSRLSEVSDVSAKVPFDELVQAALKLLAGPIARRGARVVVTSGSTIVSGDRFRLLEVVQNLLENSIKFMGDQPDPEIELGAQDRPGETLCWVRDNGIGIEPRYHEKIFNLFETLDPALEGTGIGLPLAKRIVELHGGRIEVESDGAGRGSTFWFTVPHPPADEAGDGPEAAVR